MKNVRVFCPGFICILLGFRPFPETPNIFIRKFLFTYISGILTFLLLFSACDDDMAVHDTEECISGIIVGGKCGVLAFKPDKKGALGARVWEKKSNDSLIQIENVIGIIGLPAEYTENERFFLKLRKATEEEQHSIACYTDLPGPPQPMYVVIHHNSSNCPD